MKLYFLIIIGAIVLIGGFLYLALTYNIHLIPVQECVEGTKVYGFWNGLWHGMISLISVIASLFNDDITIYAVNNNGFWYNLGFILGCGAVAGGSLKVSKNRR
jgi:hypothetical protein